MTDMAYLREDIYIEPLVRSWYATPYLVSPATSAMHAATSHLTLMKSYLAAPLVHERASKDPKMAGGPFMCFDGDRSGDVEQLQAWTKDHAAESLALADAIRELNGALLAQAKGLSLLPLYESLPKPLHGFVELVYDANGAPSFRLFERAMYNSPYYRADHQAISLRPSTGESRPFVLSTPRLESDDELRLRVPFDSAALDALFRMRTEPRPVGEVQEEFGLDETEVAALRALTCPEARPRSIAPPEAGAIAHHFGHASLLFESRGCSVLTDPAFGSDPAAALKINDLPARIDVVLLTHAHPDHVILENLLPIRHRVDTVVVPHSNGQLHDPSLRLILEAVGFRRVVELREYEEMEVPTGRIVGLPFLGEHGDLDVRSKIAYLVQLDGRTAVCAADSYNADGAVYDRVRSDYGAIDVLFVGMECEGAPLTWLYGPVIPGVVERGHAEARRLMASDAASAFELVTRLGAARAFVYAMGSEPWIRHITSVIPDPNGKKAQEIARFEAVCSDVGVEAGELTEGRAITV